MKWETWRAGILSFDSAVTSENPFLDIQIRAEFTGPSGESVSREAYWDGGKNYKISFAPTVAGEWSYRLFAPENTGLNGVTGTLNAVPYEGDLDIYRHGFLKVAGDGYRIVYADGTPFFWLGDTHWGFVAGERWDWSNYPKMDSMFRGMVDKRKAQRFTIYQTNLRASYAPPREGNGMMPARMIRTHYWADGKEGYLPDVEYYQNEIDKRMNYIADAGLVNAIGLDWANGILGLREPHINMVHYFIARYGALPLVHTIAGEAAGYVGGEIREKTIAGWREIGQEIAKTDGYHQLITAHYNTRRPFEDYYFDEPWFDFTLNQAGHGDFPIGNTDFASYRETHVGKPFVEGESMYEGCSTLEPIGTRFCTPEMMRRVAYIAMQNGASGYTYGAQGIWDTFYEKPAPDAKPNPMNQFNQFNVTWYEGIEQPGADQLTLMREFYEENDFHTLRPAAGLIPPHPVFSDPVLAELRMPIPMANADRTEIILYYIAPARGEIVLAGLPEVTYTVRWFDPRTGEYSDSFTLKSAEGRVTLPAKPDLRDWLIVLKA